MLRTSEPFVPLPEQVTLRLRFSFDPSANSPWLPAYILAVSALGSACTKRDQFECGRKVAGVVAQCDGERERCICGDAQRRCARYEPEHCSPDAGLSGYRYVFGDEECVKTEAYEQGVIASNFTDPDKALCREVNAQPPLPRTCGHLDAITGSIISCDTGVCVCSGGGGHCGARLDQCPSRLVKGTDCLARSEDDYLLTIGPGALCPEDPQPYPCGSVDSTGRLQECTGEQRCICSDDEGSCALRVDAGSGCPSNLMYVGDGDYTRCVPQALGSAHQLRCQASEPDPIRCGEIDPQTRRVRSCLEGEACACTPSGGICTKADTRACPSGAKTVHDGRCLEWSEDHFTVTLGPTNVLCPVEAPSRAQCATAEECGVGAGCLCAGDASACAFQSDACDSRLAYRGTGQCVAMGDAGTFVALGGCGVSDAGVMP